MYLAADIKEADTLEECGYMNEAFLHLAKDRELQHTEQKAHKVEAVPNREQISEFMTALQEIYQTTKWQKLAQR